METERKLIDIKKCRYMEKHLGEEFDAFVTGVTEKGAFCQIENHYVDGLVSADLLGKAFKMRFLPDFQQYSGPAKSQLKIGTRLRILVAAVDIETRRIDFEPLKIYTNGDSGAA
jgi:ribonuclease R